MKAIVFSGTSDGKKVCEILNKYKINTTVCVATEYGKEVMESREYINIHIGRMNEDEISEFIKDTDFIIDATHPYAKIISKNIRAACQSQNKEYIRVLRDENTDIDAIFVDSIQQAVEFLKNTNGKIFVSTGSNEIQEFCNIENYKDKIVARVLDTDDVRKKCNTLGFKNMIYKQAPFSVEENKIDFADCQYLVTKSSGKAGGFDEKIKAAQLLNMKIIVIKRPKETGIFIDEVEGLIKEKIKNF